MCLTKVEQPAYKVALVIVAMNSIRSTSWNARFILYNNDDQATVCAARILIRHSTTCTDETSQWVMVHSSMGLESSPRSIPESRNEVIAPDKTIRCLNEAVGEVVV